MKSLKTFLLLLIILLSVSRFYSQKRDSLWSVYKNASQTDTNRLKAIDEIATYYRSNNPDSAIIVAQQQLKLAQSSKQKKYEAKAYNTIGLSYANKGDYTIALQNYSLALKIRKEIGDKKGIAGSYNNMGIAYEMLGNNREAINMHMASLKIKEGLGDKKGIANSYDNIGTVYYKQGNNTQALKMQLEALKIREEINDEYAIAISYNNLGLLNLQLENYGAAIKNFNSAIQINKKMKDDFALSMNYNNLGNVYDKQMDLSEALKMHSSALKLRESMGDRSGVASSLHNIGIVYDKQQSYADAFKVLSQALAIREEIEDKPGVAISYAALSTVYKHLKQFKQAEEYALKALKLSKEVGSVEYEENANYALSEVYSLTGKDKEALKYFKAYIVNHDTLINEENTKKNVQAQMEYEFNKKEVATKAEQEKKDALVVEEKRKQRIITTSVTIGLILVLLLAGVILRSLRQNQKKNKIITEQKELVERQKHIVEEKHKEITDSINYAERIQRSFLATKELLDENLKNYFILFKPKDVVSGDFYWAEMLSNGNFILATADSTGHGVPGAIMSLLNITSLEKAIEHYTDPAEILGHTRQTIIKRLKRDGSAEGGKDGMDCSLMTFDFQNKKLQIAVAHNPVWIVRENDFIEIKADKMPVGKHDRDKEPFTSHTIDLISGDVIYTLTDGFPDQFGGPKGKKFMSKNLKELLAKNSVLPMHEQKELLEKIFRDWVANIEQVDDVTLIGIRV
ncbi:MAG: tetratricopeptide repeat protein [Bacteroidota bacterium]|nr:tetratricopeptide repeat protein [Bacteroidota bacterium]